MTRHQSAPQPDSEAWLEASPRASTPPVHREGRRRTPGRSSRRSPLELRFPRLGVGVAALVLGLPTVGPAAQGSAQSSLDATDAEQPHVAADDPRSPGTLRMARRLERLAGEQVRRNLYDNAGRAELLEADMAQAESDRARQRLEFALARELLWAGRTREAIEHFTAIRERALARGRDTRRSREVTSLLATAWLRLGEEQNCVARHGVDSCLMPIHGGGVHVDQQGSRSALGILEDLLERDPSDLEARWLANLAAMTLGEYPAEVPGDWLVPPAAFASDVPLERFLDVATAAGVAMEGRAGGCVVDDFDGDHDLDVLASSMGLQPADQLRYYENLGDGSFAERTAEAGLLGLVGGLNLVSGDLDNDGDLDAFVLRGGWLGLEAGLQPNSLLQNDGHGQFSDVTEEAGMLSFHPTQTAAVGDYDDDGWLDVFVGNESTATWSHPSELWHNDGDGTFTDVAPALGLAELGFVKGVAWGDVDNDGRLDLYVSTSGAKASNALFHNEGPREGSAGQGGDWSFRDVAEQAGVDRPYVGFATWFFDYDNDGWLDLYVSRYDSKLEDTVRDYLPDGHPDADPRDAAGRPCLYRNRGDGTFEDVAAAVGLDQSLMTMGCNFGDLDNDGWLDLYLGTGRPEFRTLVPNRMFRNDRGRRFQDVTTSGGFGHLQKGHGIAFADVDDDGDQDVYAVMGGAYLADTFRNALFRNPGNAHRWLGLELEGTRCNRDAIGARIRVHVRGPSGSRVVHVTVSSGGSFGAHSLRRTIGLGDATTIERVEITWPGGRRTETLEGLEPDRYYTVLEGSGRSEALDLRPIPLGPDGEDEAACCAKETAPGRGEPAATLDIGSLRSVGPPD